MSKVLVTGGAGYIGCVLIEELLKKDYNVRVLDTFYFGKGPLNNLSKSFENLENRVDILEKDVRHITKKDLDGISCVVHLAGFSNDPTAEYRPDLNNSINIDGTEIIAKICREKGIKRLTYASSASIYDKGMKFLSKEELLDESSEVNPKAAYSVSKYAGEKILLELASKKRFCPVILRQGTVYGFSPRMRYDLVVNTFVKNAFKKGIITLDNGGEMYRPIVDVRDVARAHIACLEAPEEKVRGEIFNISYDNYRIKDLASDLLPMFVQNMLNVKIVTDLLNAKPFRTYKISNQKIKDILGFKCQISPEESVIDMIKKINEGVVSDFDNPVYYNIERFREIFSG